MTEQQIAVMRQALEALDYVYEGANNQGPHTGISWRCASNKVEPAITALRRALEQPAQQEPLTDELPALPEGKGVVRGPVAAFSQPEYGTLVDFDCEGPLSHDPEDGEELFTADQMREYAIAAIESTRPQAREPLPPASPCALTEAEYKIFKLGWLECEAAHGIGEKK